MKIWQLLLAAGGCVTVGGTMFLASFHQSVSTELVSPYSTQAAIFTKDVPQPWQSLLRIGGGAIALGGGMVFAGMALSKLEPKLQGLAASLEANQQGERKALPPATSAPLPNLEVSQPAHQIEEELEYEYNSNSSKQPIKNVPSPLPRQEKPQDYWTSTEDFLPPSPPAKQPDDLVVSAAKYASKHGHLLVPCLTGTGKTSIVLGLIEHVHQLTDGKATWHIVDPKKSNWLGLEDMTDATGKPVAVGISLSNPGAGVMAAIALLDDAISELDKRINARQRASKHGQFSNPAPYIVILDEWPTILKAAKDCDTNLGKNVGASSVQQLISKAEILAFMGREDSVFVWIVSQSPYVAQLGFDGSVREQFAILSLGMGRNSKSLKPVRAAIVDCVSNPQHQSRLLHQLEELAKTNPDHPVCFTSLGDIVALVPNLEGIKSKVIFQSSTPKFPVDPLAIEFAKARQKYLEKDSEEQ